MLDLPPLLSIIGRIRIIGRDADGLIFELFGENEVEEDGYEGGYWSDGLLV